MVHSSSKCNIFFSVYHNKDEEWAIIKGDVYKQNNKGRSAKIARRAILNAIFYQNKLSTRHQS